MSWKLESRVQFTLWLAITSDVNGRRNSARQLASDVFPTPRSPYIATC